MPKVSLRDVTKRFDGTTAVHRVSFDVYPGELLTLLGPSGCGKSTTLRIIAGLEKQDEGEVYIDDKLVSSTGRGLHTPPEKRYVGMVFQSYAIWPHMTVFGNVAYPLKVRGVDQPTIRKKVSGVLEMVGLSGLEDRMATRLSGGQQQRVALARAIVFEPTLLLLDEPLSNLDAKLRGQMRYELKQLQRTIGITTLYVTHDQTESMILSDRIVVMNQGNVGQIGSPAEIYEKPKSPFVSDFVGSTNFIAGEVLGGGGAGGSCLVKAGAGDVLCQTADHLRQGERVLLAIRPEKIRIARGRSTDGAGDAVSWEGTVQKPSYAGSYREYEVRVGDFSLYVTTPSSTLFEVGERVFLEIDPSDVTLFRDSR